MTDKLKLAELTSEEARQFLNEDAVLLLPMGSLEDQGTHAPMGDYMAADAVALDMARTARKEGLMVFVAPVIPFGGGDLFKSTLGGISLSYNTLVGLLDDMLGCLTRHGIKKIMIINGHGGNVVPINDVTMRWREKTGLFVPSMYLWQVSYELLKTILGPEEAAKVSGHGGDPLTSIGLHYFPELLRPDLMQEPPAKGRKALGMEMGGNFSEVVYAGARIQVPLEAIETAPHGVRGGDPKYCKAETGKALADRLVEIGCGFIRDHVAKGFAQ